jgi:hypothetical protein
LNNNFVKTVAYFALSVARKNCSALGRAEFVHLHGFEVQYMTRTAGAPGAVRTPNAPAPQ